MDLSPLRAAVPGERLPVPRGVADRLRALIRQGDLKAGDRLPSQRDLAGQLGVSRPSLREAISSLEATGLLAVRVGSGVYVAAPEHRAPPWRFADRCSLQDLYEARIGLEGYAARLAAARVERAGLDRLGAALDAMAAALPRADVPAMAEADERFHGLVLEIAANAVLSAMALPMREMVAESQRLPMGAAERRGETLAEHSAILDRLAARDGGGAEGAMRVHVAAAAARYGVRVG